MDRSVLEYSPGNDSKRKKRKSVGADDCDEDVASILERKRSFYVDLDDPNHKSEEAFQMKPLRRLCKFYYLDQCMREEYCPYMHSEFPCKFYYFGFECRDGERCKLKHGSALQDDMKEVLWDHVTSASSVFLQRFPCFPHALLKKHLEERHNALIKMELEKHLLDNTQYNDDNSIDPISSTLLGEVIKTVVKGQPLADAFDQLQELLEIMSPEQVLALADGGVTTLDQLFKLGASTFFKLGFDCDTLIRIGILKENKRKQSIYTANELPLEEKINEEIFSSDDSLNSEKSPTHEPVLNDQELLNVLNDESSPSSINQPLSPNECGNIEQRNDSSDHPIDENGNSELQTMSYSSAKEKENDLKTYTFIDNSTVDGEKQSSTDESDSKSLHRMPFKSIINQYTPAKEIDGSIIKYPAVPYQLIPIDIPAPNFESVLKSFTIKPTHSLDPRIRLMFHIGAEMHCFGHMKANVVRDPRLNKQLQSPRFLKDNATQTKFE